VSDHWSYPQTLEPLIGDEIDKLIELASGILRKKNWQSGCS